MLQATEALRRAKFKFPGRQKIVESRNWGFTPFNRDDYVQWKQEGRMLNCGVHARVRHSPSHSPPPRQIKTVFRTQVYTSHGHQYSDLATNVPVAIRYLATAQTLMCVLC